MTFRDMLRARLNRSAQSAPCVVCHTWTFLAPDCSGGRGHDPDGFKRGPRRWLVDRTMRWLAL